MICFSHLKDAVDLVNLKGAVDRLYFRGAIIFTLRAQRAKSTSAPRVPRSTKSPLKR